MARITPFGISALSKFNRGMAYRNEIMCDKETGEFLVKTPDGDTISYNYFNRLRNCVEMLTLVTEMHCIHGDIYSIDPLNVDLPAVVNETIDIDGQHTSPGAKGIIVTIDMSAIETVANTVSQNIIDGITVEYTLALGYSDNTSETINKRISAQDMISDYMKFDKPVSNISISDATITLNTDISEKYIIVVNNILMFIEE